MTPDHTPPLDQLIDLLQNKRLVALTGAGCSTDSGIPDYRGPKTRHLARNPIRYQDYVRTPETRSRYWLRSSIGWPRMRDTSHNTVHEALARLESQGILRGVITQNVDRLHHKAGTRRVIELHGALHEVICLECKELEPRDDFQRRLFKLNPWMPEHLLARQDQPRIQDAPDGDADLDPTHAMLDTVELPGCRRCLDGMLKPHVVFFGENVPKERVERAFSLLEEAQALLVLGSSLTVYSGLRFVRRAHELGMPIVIVTLGPTRADDLATIKLDAPLAPTLTRLTDALLTSPTHASPHQGPQTQSSLPDVADLLKL